MAPRKIGETIANRAAFALLLVIGVVITTTLLTFVLVSAKLGSAHRVDLTLAESPDGGGGNYLMIGSDTRAFVESEGDEIAFGDSGDASGQRSDTIMVLHVDPDSDRALLVSFPRDLWVDIPGRGEAKINAAFNNGPQSVIDTLSANFSVPIHHYVEVNFDSFRRIVNAVGSVPVYFAVPTRDTITGLVQDGPGCRELDGQQALAFVRSRHLQLFDAASQEWENADAIPDLDRIGRQQALLRVLGKEAMNSALTNPFKANDIADAAISQLTIDQDFGRTDAFRLAASFSADDDNTGPLTVTLPTEPDQRDGQSVLDATPDADALLAQLRDFETVIAGGSGDATPADTSVRVLNASGVEGAAGDALADLQRLGFKGGGTDNASEGLQFSEVRYRPGDAAKAALVAASVQGEVEQVEDDSIDGADVILVIGESFEGIAEPAPDADAGNGQGPASAPQPSSRAPVPGC